MSKLRDQVAEFHRAFGQPIADRPGVPGKERVELRRKLHNEEADELDTELRTRTLDDRYSRLVDIVSVAKELADVLYIAYGTALEFGIDIDAVFAVVHASNMAKLGPDGKPVYRDDGKIMKPDGWKPPDIASELIRQGWQP